MLLPWSLGQQFALQTVLLRDAQTLMPRRAAVVVAAAAFAALHLPESVSHARDIRGGARLVRHSTAAIRNLLPLALSHGVLSTLVVLCALDDSVTGRLRVGAAFFAR